MNQPFPETAQPRPALAKRKVSLRPLALSGLVALALVALIVIGIRVQHILRSRPPVRVRGSLSETDRVEILKLVRRDMWQRSFTGLSWSTIRQAPISLYRLGTARINEVLVAPQPSPYSIQVAGKFGVAQRYWLLRRGPKGWAIDSEQATPWFDVFEGRVEDLLAGLNHGKVQAPPMLQGPLRDRKVVPLLFVPPGSIPPKRPPGGFDSGASFSNWTSNHAGLSLDVQR
jgi:hypothetical protein